MNLYGSPVLKIRTKDRLHITKEPGLMSYATVLSFTSIVFAVNYYVVPDCFILPAVFLSVCLLLSLNLMETWDFIMDKEENLVTLVTRSWYHGVSMKVPEENVKRFPLNCIASVVTNPDSGIDIIKRDGSCTTIKSDRQDLRSMRKLRREIATFLHFERIEYLKGKDKIFYSWDMDPWSMEWADAYGGDADGQQSSNLDGQPEPQREYGRNIKVITGPL